MMTPAAKIAAPMLGKIQWVCAFAVQPYQNRPMGTSKAPGIMSGTRNSGFPTPLFRFFSARYILSWSGAHV